MSRSREGSPTFFVPSLFINKLQSVPDSKSKILSREGAIEIFFLGHFEHGHVHTFGFERHPQRMGRRRGFLVMSLPH